MAKRKPVAKPPLKAPAGPPMAGPGPQPFPMRTPPFPIAPPARKPPQRKAK